MAFLKYANAAVVKPVINLAGWDDVRHQSVTSGNVFNERQAAKAFNQFSPNKYMLSHCTIIASVDTEEGPGPLGRQLVDGFQVDRQYGDYYITPGTTQYVNNNNDSWERKLLLSAFHTFIGGENYVEHLQIPELSKGKIVDAVARDIGDSIYVDILVATDKKHKPLVAAIESQQLQTLSMGCSVRFTICSRCGNIAIDETQLCPHIRYGKGNTFQDALGQTRKTAELCGHFNAEPGSVKFVEASWVGNPAFKGAVLRNILTPQEAEAYSNRIQVAFSQPARTADASLMQRAAFNLKGFNFEDEESFEGEGESTNKEEKDPLETLVDEVADKIRDLAKQKVKQELSGGGLADLPADRDEDLNNTLIKEAALKNLMLRQPAWLKVARMVLKRVQDPVLARKILRGLVLYKKAGWEAVRQSREFSGREILAISQFADQLSHRVSMAGENRIYRTVLAVGGMTPYPDVNSYLAVCRRIINRDLTGAEKEALVLKGKLYDLGS
jgi:hypothetical protein